jgi:hypothetical protein
MGVYMFSVTQIGYFFSKQEDDNLYKMAIISNAMTATSIAIYKINYDTVTHIPTVSLFLRKDMYSYFMIGSILGVGGKKAGLIEFSDGESGTFSCYVNPQFTY